MSLVSKELRAFRPAQTTRTSLADTAFAASPGADAQRILRSGTLCLLMTGWTSPTHIILLLLIALLLFGAKRLPEIGRSLGSGMREFKDSVTGNTPAEPEQPQQVQQQLTPPQAVETTTTAPSPEHERETV